MTRLFTFFLFLFICIGSLNANNQEVPFKLYPNPGQNEIYISAKTSSNADVSVLDASGRLLSTENISLPGKLSHVPNMKGIYLIRIANSETNQTLKWIHQ